MTKNLHQMKDARFDKIRNRNEKHVRRLIPAVLEEFADYNPSAIDLEDIYALTLNNLPPRYTQRGTIVLTGKLTDDEVKAEIRLAVEKVELNPTWPDS